jgi:hypothetical protein
MSRDGIVVSGPVEGLAMTSAYVEAIGRFAYVWGWPMVSMTNRRTALTSVSEPGLRGGVLPNAPVGHVCMLTDYIPAEQRFVACTNQDVLYGFGFGALNDEPVVIQIPDYGERFWVTAVWNHRTDSMVQLGKQYGTKPGFYVVVGPNWDGKTPAGITEVFHSPTELAAFCPRVFVNDTDEDRIAVLPLINATMAYPLAEFDGTVKTKDWNAIPSFPAPTTLGSGEVHWVDPEKFFDQLPQVLETVPPLPGEEALYGLIASVLNAAEADLAIKQTLVETAMSAERDLITPLLEWRLNGPAAGNGWFSPTNNSAFGTDYMTRTAIARSNMYENAAHETKYVFTDTDATGKSLDGHSLYTITFPAGQLPPVNGFWSLTLYNEHHFYNVNPLNRYSLGTKSPDLQTNPDGSLTLYAGATSPGPDNASNWLPAPGGPFSLYIRGYWPKPEMLDRTWTPPTIAIANP